MNTELNDKSRKVIERARSNSVRTSNQENRRISYAKKKRKRAIARVKALLAAVCLTISVSSFGVGYHVGHRYGDYFAISSEAKNYVDDRVDFFKRVFMYGYPSPNCSIMSSDDNIYMGTNKIVRVDSYDSSGNPRFDYDNAEAIIARVISLASTVSEEEVRCAVLGAYNAIVECRKGFREAVLDGTFSTLSSYSEFRENVPDELSYLLGGSLKSYYGALGYIDFNEWVLNERTNLKRQIDKFGVKASR